MRTLLDASSRVWGEQHVARTGAVLAGLLCAAPMLGLDQYALHLCALVFVYAALGLGLNVVIGLAGLLDLGYVGFYAVGAYGYALLARMGVSFLPALIIAATVACSIGVVLGWPTIRTRGDYLALVTLGFGEMIRIVVRNWYSVTNGPQGLMNIPPPSLSSFRIERPLGFYYLGLALAALAVTVFWRLKQSSVGRCLAAIGDDEDAAAACGVAPVKWKLYAFAIGAGLAGMAGVFFASWQRFVSPESFTLNESILIVCIVVLGGMGKTWPTVAAAAFLVLLPEALRGLENYRALVLGCLLIGVVLGQTRLARDASVDEGKDSEGLSIEESLTESSESAESSVQDTTAVIQAPGVLIRVANLAKSFGGVKALEDVSFEVRRTEVVGIIGSNGAGKTTLFSCLSGAMFSDRGSVMLCDGESTRPLVRSQGPDVRAHLGLVRTFQQPRVFRSLTTLGNIQVGALCGAPPPIWEPLLRRKDQSPEQLRELALAVGCPSLDTLGFEMGFLEQKLTELARALATGSKLLLLDEPAAGLAPESRHRMARLIRKMNDEGLTLLVIEHDVDFLLSICTRFLVMQEGHLIADGAPQQEAVQRAVRDTYGYGVTHVA